MDQKNIIEAKKLLHKDIIPQINGLIRLSSDSSKEEYRKKQKKNLDNQIRLLKEYLNPRNQKNKHVQDKEVFTMADTMSGLLKKFDKKSLESIREICNGIKKEI